MIYATVDGPAAYVYLRRAGREGLIAVFRFEDDHWKVAQVCGPLTVAELQEAHDAVCKTDD